MPIDMLLSVKVFHLTKPIFYDGNRPKMKNTDLNDGTSSNGPRMKNTYLYNGNTSSNGPTMKNTDPYNCTTSVMVLPIISIGGQKFRLFAKSATFGKGNGIIQKL
jgi:hypothetical protein